MYVIFITCELEVKTLDYKIRTNCIQTIMFVASPLDASEAVSP